MQDFLLFYNEVKKGSWALEIYHSSIMDWCITIGYKVGHLLNGTTIIHVQNYDMQLVFAKAQVELKEWLSKFEGGY